MYISRYLYVSTQLLLAGADDNPQHHCPEAALVDVPRHLVVIMFRVLISRHQHTVFRRFIIEPGVRRQHHWQRLIGRTNDGLFWASRPLPTMSSTSTTRAMSAGILGTVSIKLLSWLSTSCLLSSWRSRQHSISSQSTTMAPTTSWIS